MATGSYDDILRRAREELSHAERSRLVEELANGTEASNGTHDNSRSLYEALNDRGLIGFMHDGPSDLSTNPKHMEGFGKHVE